MCLLTSDFKVLPISAGLGATLTPAVSSALILSLAVPLPPLMMMMAPGTRTSRRSGVTVYRALGDHLGAGAGVALNALLTHFATAQTTYPGARL